MSAANAFAMAAAAIGLGALSGGYNGDVREPHLRLFLTAGLLFAVLAVALARQS